MRSGVEGIPWKHGPPARDTSARAGVTAFGPGRWCDEHNLVGSAAFGCINGHPGQAKRKSRLTGRGVGWCWERLKRESYAFETKEGDKHVTIPRIVVSRSISTEDGSVDGEDEQGYIATGLKINEVPKGIELTKKAFRVLNFEPGDKFSVEVDGVKYSFLVAQIYGRVLHVKSTYA